MAHPQQLQFIKSVTSLLNINFQPKKVLEVGSYDVNGSVRQFFPYADYTGVDLIPGPGVDLVCEGDKIPHDDNIYDVTISCECFEHNPAWAETFNNMWRMTRLGGLVIFTCATTGRAEHGTTRTSPKSSPGTQALNWDYYKNLTEEDFHQQFDFHNLFGQFFFLTNFSSCDLYFLGVKGQCDEQRSFDLNNLKNMCKIDQDDLLKMMMVIKKRERYVPKGLRKMVRKILHNDLNRGKNSRLIDIF